MPMHLPLVPVVLVVLIAWEESSCSLTQSLTSPPPPGPRSPNLPPISLPPHKKKLGAALAIIVMQQRRAWELQSCTPSPICGLGRVLRSGGSTFHHLLWRRGVGVEKEGCYTPHPSYKEGHLTPHPSYKEGQLTPHPPLE